MTMGQHRSLLRTPATPPVNLLLQHDAVHTSLEQRKRQACLALQVAQAVEDVGARVRREVVERGGELQNLPPSASADCKEVGGTGAGYVNLVHVLGQALVLLEDLLLEGRELRRGEEVGGSLVHGCAVGAFGEWCW